MVSLRTFEVGITLAFSVLLLLAYSSLSPLLGLGIAITVLGVYLRKRSLQDVVFFSTVTYTAPFAILFSTLLPVVLPGSYEALVEKIVASPYFSSLIFALAVMGTAVASEVVFIASSLGNETGSKVLAHSLPHIVVSVAVTSLLFALVYGAKLRLSPAIIPLLVLVLGVLMVPKGGGKRTVVVVECERGPVSVITEKGERELWPNPLTRLHNGKFRVKVEVEGKVLAVFVGERKAGRVISGSDGERDFALYR